MCLSAQLVINEVSQGSNNKEYTELLVLGSTGCPTECVDIRNWIVDDNNGWFAAGSGTGIANGHIRFRNTSQWSCVKPGSLIVLYNNSDINPNLPPQDETDANNDCVYVLPYSSILLERNSNVPNLSNPNFLGPYALGGNWNGVIMRNGGDSYQTVSPSNLTQPHHAVSWGNNTSNTIIYFAGSASGDVFYMSNNIDDDPSLTTNWSIGSTSTQETPGAPNNAANAAWINGMNNNCMPASFADAGADVGYCVGDSNTSTTLTASGGVSYVWSTGDMTASTTVSPVATTTYTVTVTDATSCTSIDEVMVVVDAEPNPSISPSGTLCTNGSISLDASTGFDAYEWSNTEMTPSISISSAGTYTVEVTDSFGCTGTSSVTISSLSPPVNFMR